MLMSGLDDFSINMSCGIDDEENAESAIFDGTGDIEKVISAVESWLTRTIFNVFRCDV